MNNLAKGSLAGVADGLCTGGVEMGRTGLRWVSMSGFALVLGADDTTTAGWGVLRGSNAIVALRGGGGPFMVMAAWTLDTFRASLRVFSNSDFGRAGGEVAYVRSCARGTA